jgi:uncharacterized membrane protein
MKSGSLINNYSLLLGIFLLAEGIWGLFSSTVFTFMTTNLNHAVIHIALGVLGIVLSVTHKAYGYLIFTGSVLAVAGAIYMIPATRYIVVQWFNMNEVVAVFNVVAGLIALMVAYVGNRYMYVSH